MAIFEKYYFSPENTGFKLGILDLVVFGVGICWAFNGFQNQHGHGN